MKRDQRRRRVPRERKQKFAFALLRLFLVWHDGYARKRRRLPRLHRYATKVDRSLEPSLDDGFDEVAGSHRRTARGEEQVCLLESLGNGLYVCVDARIFPLVMGCPKVEENRGHTRRVRFRGRRLYTPFPRVLLATRGGWYRISRPIRRWEADLEIAGPGFRYPCSTEPR